MAMSVILIHSILVHEFPAAGNASQSNAQGSTLGGNWVVSGAQVAGAQSSAACVERPHGQTVQRPSVPNATALLSKTRSGVNCVCRAVQAPRRRTSTSPPSWAQQLIAGARRPASVRRHLRRPWASRQQLAAAAPASAAAPPPPPAGPAAVPVAGAYPRDFSEVVDLGVVPGGKLVSPCAALQQARESGLGEGERGGGEEGGPDQFA